MTGKENHGAKSTQTTLESLKEKLVTANKILESEKLATPFGHISVRIPDTDTFFITRSISPALATKQDIVVCDMSGNIVEGEFSDTYSEVVIHTGVYKKRKEVNSVIHFHSTYVIGLSLAGHTVIPANLQAAVMGPKSLPVYKKMVFIDKQELGDAVADQLGSDAAVILKGHGAVTVGENIEEAIYRALTLERSAMYQWLARSVGNLEPVSDEDMNTLLNYHGNLKREGHGPFREWTYYSWKLKNEGTGGAQ